MRGLSAATATFARVALRVAACFDACKATFGFLLLAVFAAARRASGRAAFVALVLVPVPMPMPGPMPNPYCPHIALIVDALMSTMIEGLRAYIRAVAVVVAVVAVVAVAARSERRKRSEHTFSLNGDCVWWRAKKKLCSSGPRRMCMALCHAQ